MARNFKFEIAAVNLRIPEDKKRDYNDLIEQLARMRRSIRVYGDTYVVISSYNKRDQTGVISKYTEIDIDGDWFNKNSFDAATPDQLGEINIPEHLKPNFASFYFSLDATEHVLAVTTYARSHYLSTNAIKTYFKTVLESKDIYSTFGRVESDLVKDYGKTEDILKLPHLKELDFVIRPPNSDDIGPNLAKVIEDRLREQNADEYEEKLRAKGKNDINPNERTRVLAAVAAENGEMRARNLESGVKVSYSTNDIPLIERDIYTKEASDLSIFKVIAKRLFAKIAEKRLAVRRGSTQG